MFGKLDERQALSNGNKWLMDEWKAQITIRLKAEAFAHHRPHESVFFLEFDEDGHALVAQQEYRILADFAHLSLSTLCSVSS